MADGKVTISTLLDNAGLKKGVEKIEGSFGGLKSVLGRIGAAVAAAFSVRALIDFGTAAIELGSNLAEVQNVVDVSFGNMASAAEEFASTAITQFGMSELAAKKTASTYMAMAKGLGVAEGTASNMAITLAGLSGDVASFFNLDQEAAAKKLQGVFTGETEALKELGVVMTQTNLKQFALEHGMNANIESMSQAELVALRYAFVMDALSLASGDFVRTQDSWANQTRILSMQWQQFMGVIGQTLTTVLLPAVKLLNNVVGVLISAAQRIQTAITSIFGVSAEQTGAVAQSALEGAAAEEELAAGITEAGKAAKKAAAGFDELNILQNNAGGGDAASTGVSGGTVSAGSINVDADVNDTISPKIALITEKLKQLLEPLKKIDLSPLKKAFEGLGEAIKPLTKDFFSGLEWLYTNILVPLAAWTIEEALPAFLDTLSAALDFLNEVTEAFKPLGQWLWEEFLQPLGAWTGDQILNALKLLERLLIRLTDGIHNLRDKFNQLKELAVQALTVIKTNWQAFPSWFRRNVLDKISASFLGLINGLIGYLNGMLMKMERGINSIIDMLNRLSFEVPQGVPVLGGKTFGFNIGYVQVPHIPYLAQGAVLPPNKPFMAVVGDQSNGTNIEAPLETIKQALAEVLSTQGVNIGDININFTGSLAQLARILKPVIDVENHRVGNPIVRRSGNGK